MEEKFGVSVGKINGECVLDIARVASCSTLFLIGSTCASERLL